MSFSSQQKIKLSKTDAAVKEPGVVYPTLNDFLKITQLTQYTKKLKKIKCVEVADLIKMTDRVGFVHVEEQRVKRYIDLYDKQVLTSGEQKPQPISLSNFCRLAKLPVEKQLRSAGVVEFDDLPWIAYADLEAMFPKKIELFRFKRYIEKISNSPEAGKYSAEGLVGSDDLKSFVIEAKLKQHKNTFEKLGVVETDDLLSISRPDVPKMGQVEFDRFVRYREKFKDKTTEFEKIAPGSEEPEEPFTVRDLQLNLPRQKPISLASQPYSPVQQQYPPAQPPYSPVQQQYPPVPPPYSPVQQQYPPGQQTYSSAPQTYPPVQQQYPEQPSSPQPYPVSEEALPSFNPGYQASQLPGYSSLGLGYFP